MACRSILRISFTSIIMIINGIYYSRHQTFRIKFPEKNLIDEGKHEITFDMSEFEKVEHVKITFKCEREGFDNPSANASSGATALTPKGEGNQTRGCVSRAFSTDCWHASAIAP